VCWEPVTAKGTIPGKISHHKPCVFGSSVVVFGGISEVNNVYEFDSVKCSWSVLKQAGDIPKQRDDHSLSVIDDCSFLIFGGFVEGSRVNEAYVCTKNGQTLTWKKCG
jgi:leucine-zipper-like transcriptional regulator 1